jgi:hypothetical protein
VTEDTATGTQSGNPYVFVCYAHDERDLVVSQIEWLRSQGFNVWFDEAIEAGHRWSEDLARAVEGCAVFLYFLSPRSSTSRYCLDEVHFALECSRPIVPVEIAPVTLTPGLRLSLGATHRIFMYKMQGEEFRQKMASGLRTAMSGGQTAHAIETRTAAPRPLAMGLMSPSGWRPTLLGVFAALLAFIGMMVFGG